MSQPSLPREGGCRCDRVRFRVTAPAIFTSACHCKGCQKMTASAFSLSMAIPTDGFAVIAGETVIGGLHGHLQHHFCAWCMSWMFTTAEEMPFFNVRTTMLDDPSGFEPFLETWTAEKLAWAATPAIHSFPTVPSMDDYPRLLAEYIDWQERR